MITDRFMSTFQKNVNATEIDPDSGMSEVADNLRARGEELAELFHDLSRVTEVL
jgi:hypothetical protein